MKRSLAAVALFTLSFAAHAGQTVTLKDLVHENGKRFQQLKQGMTRADVVRVMKDDVAEIPGGTVANPYKTKAVQKGGSNYEVLYYVTQQATAQKNAMTSPVLLKDGVVTGLTAESLRSLSQ
ncbi:MAG: hypothetical protein ACT4PK_10570 [Gammaproteobacteria bacterium]